MIEYSELKNTEKFKQKKKKYYKQVFLNSMWSLLYIWIGWLVWVGLILFGYIPIPEDWNLSFYMLYSIPVLCWIISKFCFSFNVCQIHVDNKRSSLDKNKEKYKYYIFENCVRFEVENTPLYDVICIDKTYTFLLRGKNIVDIF